MASARAPQTAGAIFGSFAQVYQMYREVFQNILRNDADIQGSLDRLKAEADLLIEEYNLLVPCEEM